MTSMGLFLFFPLLMIFAACSDLFTMTISNRVSVALVLGFLIFALWLQLPLAEVGLHFVCGAAILCITFTMFAFGWVGGGDAKLAAATAVWLGFDHILDYGLFSAVFGGFLTLALLAVRRWPLPASLLRYSWITRLHDQKTGIPYGIALAIAGLLLYPDTSVWTKAIGA